MREIYFKPFEMCVKDNVANGGASGLISWQIILIVVDVILAAAVIALEVITFKRYKKRVKVA